MTIYQRAKRHLWTMLLSVVLSFVFVVIWERSFGPSSIPFFICAFILIVMNLRIWRYNCPRCSSNLFMRKWVSLPWPNATCSHCGLDLTGDRPVS